MRPGEHSGSSGHAQSCLSHIQSLIIELSLAAASPEDRTSKIRSNSNTAYLLDVQKPEGSAINVRGGWKPKTGSSCFSVKPFLGPHRNTAQQDHRQETNYCLAQSEFPFLLQAFTFSVSYFLLNILNYLIHELLKPLRPLVPSLFCKSSEQAVGNIACISDTPDKRPSGSPYRCSSSLRCVRAPTRPSFHLRAGDR
jgi:hypothetical protein